MGWLDGSLCNFISFIGLVTTRLSYEVGSITTHAAPRPADPSQRKCLSLESTERGIASISAGDEALRNALVDMQKAQRLCVLAASPSE